MRRLVPAVLGVLFWPQFAIVFPYTAVVIVLLLWPRGILKSAW
jgi:branched-subunit amino acid ABC-type transport system permease component